MLLSCAAIVCFLSTAAFALNISSTGPASRPAEPTTGTIIDDSAAGWVWRDAVEVDDSGLYGGSAHAGRSGCYAAFTFQGTSLEVYCMEGPYVEVDGSKHKLGHIKVSVDGAEQGEFSLQASQMEDNDCVFKATGLSGGNHVLELRADAGWIVVDYLKTGSLRPSAGGLAEASPQPDSAVDDIPAGKAHSQSKRALWMWDTSRIIGDEGLQSSAFRFMAAPHGDRGKSIDVLFCAGLTPSDLSSSDMARRLRAFIRSAHARRIRVDFLCGEPSWAQAAGSEYVLFYLSGVIAFNQADPDTAFDGFDYNVRPYLLSGWPSSEQMSGLVQLIDRSRQRISAANQSMLLVATVPTWYDQDQYQYLDRYIIDRADEVVVLDYVNTPTRLTGDAAGILTYASQHGKHVWLGVDTGPSTSNTFYGIGNEHMESVLATALPKCQTYSSFAGYAIESYETYLTLTP